MEGRTIEVCGVPDFLPPDRTVDKLTIHFLRPRNGGGEVLRVIYPTSTTGQAFVVFEHSEVASQVAGLKQTLDIGDHQFPLKIKIIDRSEVDLPVQATLDLHMFPDQNEVLQLLKSHKFKVSEQGSNPGLVLLEGTFLNLRAVRTQLQKQLQVRGHPTEPHANRNRPLSVSDDIAAGALPKGTSRTLPHMNGSNHGYPGDRPNTNSPEAYLSARSLSVSRSPTSLGSSSGSSVSSYNHTRDGRFSQKPAHLLQDSGAPQSLPIFPSDIVTTKPPRPFGASSVRETTFQVDSDLLHYTWSFKKDDVDNILKVCDVHQSTSENVGVSTVRLVGKDPERAKQKLQELTSVICASLRTQEIPLSQLNHSEKVLIGKRIQMFKEMYKVYVRQSPTSIVITGSSIDSYEMKQRLLGEPVPLSGSARTGREAVRGPKTRRSASLPKQPKSRPDQHVDTRLDSLPVSATVAYSPSYYQDDKESRVAAILGSRRRTTSESRDRRVDHRPLPKEPEPEPMSPSSGARMPLMKKGPLNVFENSTKSIKKKWHDITKPKK